jgi:excisionase family DNA binding protein
VCSSSVPSAQASTAPLAVPPAEAARLLSVGISHLYALLRAGELQSYSDGRVRRVVVASIVDYIARRIADSTTGWRTWRHNPQARRLRQEGA